MPEDMRRAMQCGYMPDSQWTQPSVLGHFDIAGEQYDPPICPGWMVRQEAVLEVSDAWNALERGGLSAMFPDPGNSLIEGVQILDRAMSDKRRRDSENR